MHKSAEETYSGFNNFLNNTEEDAFAYAKKNMWDASYPLGGNYWSDYWSDFNVTDWYRGEFQNITGMDGIGDVKYDINGTNGECTDRYPLMHPWTRPRNWGFEWCGWSVYVSLDWNASSGWRDRRGDVDADGDVDILMSSE